MGLIRHFSTEKTDNYRAKRNAHKKTATQADSGLIMYQPPRGERISQTVFLLNNSVNSLLHEELSLVALST